MTAAKIAIADDQELVRRGLRVTLLERPGWTVCGEAATGREVVEVVRQSRPDVVILDGAMRDMSGVDAARAIRAEHPGAEILLMAADEDGGVLREALAAGVRGILPKADGGRLLGEAVEALLRKQTYLPEPVSQILLQGIVASDGPADGDGGTAWRLSPREREVIKLIAEGGSTKEVAGRLGISPKTAETHRTNIMRKLDLHSVTELVRFAIRHRIVEA